MPTCQGEDCGKGFETVLNVEAQLIAGGFKHFIEVFAFITFSAGVILNTTILTVLISIWPDIDFYDGALMNICFGELVASFGLAFVFFVQFTTSMAPIGDTGCAFINWLDVTSVTITSMALIVAVYELHGRLWSPNVLPSRRKFIALIAGSWIFAALPGTPYMDKSYMDPSKNICRLHDWGETSEIIYVCMMLVVQVLVPLAILTFAFVRILLYFKAPREGDAALEDDARPGSEASLQRRFLRRKASLLLAISIVYFAIVAFVSLLELTLALNVDDLASNGSKFRRVRVLNEILLCIKVVAIPGVMLAYYDKFRMRFKSLCCPCAKRTNQEIYNSLRYNVYQDTVQDQGAVLEDASTNVGNISPSTTVPNGEPMMRNGAGSSGIRASVTDSLNDSLQDDDQEETERDDVAILGSPKR